MVFFQKDIPIRLLIAGLAFILTLGLLATTTVQARQKHREPPSKPPAQCKIPDGLYTLSGGMRGDSDINATLGMIQGRPVLHFMDKRHNRQTLVARMPGRPYHAHKGDQPHHVYKRQRQRSHQSSHDSKLHDDHRQRDKPKLACVNTMLTMRWHNQHSAPAGLSGELELTYRNKTLTGFVQLSGNNINVDDNSVTFLAQ